MQAVVSPSFYRCAVLAAALSFGSFATAEDISTKDGKRFLSVKVIQVDPNGIFIRHSRGMAKVSFDELSSDIQKRYRYDAKAAAEFEEFRSEEPPARPAPPPEADEPGGFRQAAGSVTFGPILNSVQSVRYHLHTYPPNLAFRPWVSHYPGSMLSWRQHSLYDLLATSRFISPPPWIWGGYKYPLFRR